MVTDVQMKVGTFNEGVEASADLLQAKADELRSIGNLTADTMARVFDEQVAAIRALRRELG